MCGFCGFLQFDPAVEAHALTPVVRSMADVLAHRGPDDRGEWIHAPDGIALAHRRLSIIDLSAAGHQPMTSPAGRYVIVFNGEIYNFPALREELQSSGVAWRGHSDTEVMLAGFDAWGIEPTIRRLNGMFAFAAWDKQDKTLHLARDRLGEKPLYYGWLGKTFVFASELKALRLHPAWKASVDRNALAAYMRHNYVPAPHSIYQGISKLPAAHYLRIGRSRSDAVPQPYWSVRNAAEAGVASPVRGDETAAVAELDTLLRDAVKMRTLADVPVGVFLSGGVDSSTIVGLMQAQSARPVKSFSIGFDEESLNEAVYAKAVARHLGTDHTELYVSGEEAMSVIPRLPHLYDEPFADSSQIPTVLVSQLARSEVTVALTGDGGDELFGGYVRYFWGRRVWNRIGLVPRAIRGPAGRALSAWSPEKWNTVLGCIGRFLPRNALGEIRGERLHKLAEVLAVDTPDALYNGLISHWPEPEALVLGSREARTVVNDPSQWADLSDFTLRMMYLDAVSYLPDDILVKVDRASMSCSLETRVPFLDHRVVEYAWRLPLSMKVRDNQGKWILRQVLDRYVPRTLIDRPKMGFAVPLDSWLRGPLREWAEDLLDERRLREQGYLDPARVRTIWAEHKAGTHDWQYWLWDVLMFQSWLAHETAPVAEVAHA